VAVMFESLDEMVPDKAAGTGDQNPRFSLQWKLQNA
jgi:hypothetical protein